MNQKFAASVWIWSPGLGSSTNADRALLEKISSFGFDGLEIPTLDGFLDPVPLLEILGAMRSRSRPLTPIIIGGGSAKTDLSSDSSITRNTGIAYVKRLIDLCRKLDGELICGPLYSAVGAKRHLSGKDRSKVLDLLAMEFKELGEYARERSVRIALEPLCRYDTYLLNTTAQGKELVDLIGSEHIGLLLDTFHMNIEEKSIEAAIILAGQKLFHFHACENDRGTPGTGLVRWNEVRNGLNKVNYQKWISIESFVPDAELFSSAMNVWRRIEPDQDEIAVSGLAFLRKLLGS